MHLLGVDLNSGLHLGIYSFAEESLKLQAGGKALYDALSPAFKSGALQDTILSAQRITPYFCSAFLKVLLALEANVEATSFYVLSVATRVGH